MKTLQVPLPGRSYPIHIGRGLLDKSELLVPLLTNGQAVIVSNSTIAPLYLERVSKSLQTNGIAVSSVVIPDGEQYKNWQTLNDIFNALLKTRCERSTTLIALGGGVVGDIAGFAAACYQRGMPFIQMPTTLLAQVDSSVGGKTAINHPLGKNMIGAFYQPEAVVADTETLSTLPDRELAAGMAEVIKYGLIRDALFFNWLETNINRVLAREPEALSYIIERSCANKAEIVAADEREQGIRALLNLGHTFGHAIETGMGYGAWLHGEGVAAGTMMAVELSRLLGWLNDEDVARIARLFEQCALPVNGPQMSVERYLELMAHDKKVESGRLRLVLLKAIGEAVVTADVSVAQIAEAIRRRNA